MALQRSRGHCGAGFGHLHAPISFRSTITYSLRSVQEVYVIFGHYILLLLTMPVKGNLATHDYRRDHFAVIADTL